MAFLFRPDLILNVIPIIGTGMLGIFLVTGLIIGFVKLLNKLSCDSLTIS